MTWFVAVAATIAFMWSFRAVRLPSFTRAAILDARDSFGKLASPVFDDDEKERLARTSSFLLLRHAIQLLLLAGCALLPSALIVSLAILLGVSGRDLFDAFSSWLYLLLTLIALATEQWFRRS